MVVIRGTKMRICLIALVFLRVESLSILGVFPACVKSHFILHSAIMKRLAASGHEVTVVSPFSLHKKLVNYKEIVLEGLLEKSADINFFDMQEVSIWKSVYKILSTVGHISNSTVNHPNFKKLLRSNAEFDVVILEIFVDEALIGLGHYFEAPVIGIGTFGANNQINNLVGTPSQSSVVPHPFLRFSDRMTFRERFYNLFFNIYDHLLLHFVHYPTQKEIYDAGFPGPKPDFYNQLKHGVALTLVNSHFSIGHPQPMVPNMIEIGGAHIDRRSAPLPMMLQNIMDTATDGVIYFSMGTKVKSAHFPLGIREAIVKTFAKFPRITFLWKWESDTTELSGHPENVYTGVWLPQGDLLAHPKIRCFITHAGLLSVTESIYHGVPIVGIPVFADQHLNMQRAVDGGYGLMIDYKNLTEESLTWAITEMLSSNVHKDAAVEVSRRYRDQPMAPLDLMTYWVEYVARHKGAPFMQSAAQNLYFWQYHMLDVGAFLLIILVLVYKLISKRIRDILEARRIYREQKLKRH